MTDRRDPPNQHEQPGRSRFAQRGQSHEERMPEDDSARRFPGEGRSRQDARYDAQATGQQDGYYGSGGSYGYGGGFDHRGEAGYQDPERRGSYGRGAEEFYESTGGFGHDVAGYGRAGLGYPGPGEDRYGSRGAQGFRREPQKRDDASTGYSQDSGYAQSGGAKREGTGQGSGYGSSASHSDGNGHQGGGTASPRFYGSTSSGQPGRGRFYGRTPQGYTRSDERIREDICDQLSHGHIDPSEVSVKVEGGLVTLEGFAESRSEKFHIEEVADGVLGVKEIENRLRIRRAEMRDERVLSSEPKPVVEPDPTKRSVNPTKGASS